jgi:hypothetical protein
MDGWGEGGQVGEAAASPLPSRTPASPPNPTTHRHTNQPPEPTPQDFTLPRNVRATTDAAEAIAGASYAVHAVPVQHSRSFLAGVAEFLPKDVPIICVSKVRSGVVWCGVVKLLAPGTRGGGRRGVDRPVSVC